MSDSIYHQAEIWRERAYQLYPLTPNLVTIGEEVGYTEVPNQTAGFVCTANTTTQQDVTAVKCNNSATAGSADRGAARAENFIRT